MDAITQALIDARKSAGLTQSQLAETLGWSQSTLADIERGRRALPRAIYSKLPAHIRNAVIDVAIKQLGVLRETEKVMLADYHVAWLSNHPTRTAEWLQERLRDGFEVHHIEPSLGDDPTNLILIERQDHKMIHGAGKSIVRCKERSDRNLRFGASAYAWRCQGKKWREIADILGLRAMGDAEKAAKWFAAEHKHPWPVIGARTR